MSILEYRTVDKSTWGDGPWHDEPDKLQWKDETTGYPCLIVRNPVGALCGYVGVSDTHPFFEHHYWSGFDEPDTPIDNIQVHGGLTFADHCQEGDECETICHIPEPGESDHVWWFGFDCAHCGDLSPMIEARDRKRYEETKDPLWLPITTLGIEYRTLDYVKEQVRSLAAQLKSLEGGE